MNTKFFLLLLVSLLFATATNPATISFKKDNYILLSGKSQPQKLASSHEVKGSGHDMSASAWMRVVARTKKDDYVIDDDGKFHKVHYERIAARRNRRTLCICLSAGLLTIVYVCTLIANYLHMIH